MYIGSSQLTNILNIRNEAPERIRMIAASTPSGKHEEYYKWCVGASKKYHAKPEDVANFTFTGYNIIEQRGNGWTEICAPSIVNKELLKTNPDTEQTYLQDIKDELSELRYEQEVMAEFGEEQMGVYQKKFIEAAIEEGKRIGLKYTTDLGHDDFYEFISRPKRGPRILGVDWDKYQAGTSLCAIELDKLYMNKHGVLEPKFRVLFTHEVPRTEFTLTNAVNKIIEFNDIYDFDWIAVDRGFGETQVELLHKYGAENPYTGLHEKVVGYHFGEKIAVRDPHTMQKESKDLKPFMVNNSVVVFEKEKIILNPRDKKLREQLEAYVVKSISSSGRPIYTDENEHFVDALNLCLLIFEQKYGELLRRVIRGNIYGIENLFKKDKEDKKVVSRSVEDTHERMTNHVNFGKKNTNFSRSSFGGGNTGFSGRSSGFSRRGF